MPKCEICGADANVHIVEVELEGGQRQRALCVRCASQEGFTISESLAPAIQRLRALTSFVRANNRMPSPSELRRLGGVGEMPPSSPGSPEFNEQLQYLEAVANFMEQHGRAPTDEELPDPF